MGIFTTVLTKQHNYFYLCDFRSRDERGLSVVRQTSILLKFFDFMEVEKYIQAFRLEHRNLDQSYFQLKFVCVNKERILISDILPYY